MRVSAAPVKCLDLGIRDETGQGVQPDFAKARELF
tara:strand:- start:114 stop:218 length:105 start_codon:yes stop_codon:yes gene_type:complete